MSHITSFLEGYQIFTQEIYKAAKLVSFFLSFFLSLYFIFCIDLSIKEHRNGCLTFYLNYSKPFVLAVLAVAATSLCIQIKGAIPSMPDRSTVSKLLQGDGM